MYGHTAALMLFTVANSLMIRCILSVLHEVLIVLDSCDFGIFIKVSEFKEPNVVILFY
jgi:hypothetical protein